MDTDPRGGHGLGHEDIIAGGCLNPAAREVE